MSTIPLLKRIGLKVIDLMILVVALFWITFSTVPAGGIVMFGVDFLTLTLIVFSSYIAVLMFVGILMSGVGGGDSWFARVARGAISGMLVFFCFPYLLGIIMFLVGMRLGTDVQFILMLVSVVRVVVASVLGHRWQELVP